MKSFLFACFALFLLAVSCKKQETTKPQTTPWNGTVSYKRNGVYYDAKIVSSKDTSPADSSKIQITIVRFNAQGEPRDQLNFGNISPSVHTDTLTEGLIDTIGNKEKGRAYTLYTLAFDDGDAIAFYSLFLNEVRILRITSYDSLTKEISGEFETTFIPSSHSQFDTVRFKEGVFHTKVQ